MEREKSSEGDDRRRGVYGISVAADLAGTGPQNLRLYERRGLLEPARSAGGTRLYSANDVDRVQRIIQLLADGLNLAGVAMVLDLEDDNARLRARKSGGPRSAPPLPLSSPPGLAQPDGQRPPSPASDHPNRPELKNGTPP